MASRPQTTLTRPAALEGPGLFSGEVSRVEFTPAEAYAGIVFVREQGDRKATIPAAIGNLLERSRRTTLQNDGLVVETTEHALAAAVGLGVSNLSIRVTGGLAGELPGLDGSALPFAQALVDAGVTSQASEIEPVVVRRPLQVEHQGASILIMPATGDEFEILYDYEAPAPIGRQFFAIKVTPETFMRELAPARTFVLEQEANELRARGMGRHLTTKDLLVIGPNGPVDNAFRFPDECVRHKIVDLIGDLALLGRPLVGRIIARRSGHAVNHLLVQRLLEQLQENQRERVLKRDAALDVRQIQRILPHRYPMLLVDRVLEIQGDRKAIGVKNVTFGDIFFQGHFPGTPIMPGVLVVEALAQLGGILLSKKLEHTGKVAVLLSVDRVKIRTPAVPGDQIILEVEAVRVKTRMGHVRCRAFIREQVSAEAEVKFLMVDSDQV